MIPRAIKLIAVAPLAILIGVSQAACADSAPQPGPPEEDAGSISREAERRAIATMAIDLDEATQVLRSLSEAFSRNEYNDLEEHGAELVALARAIRRQTVDLPRSDAEIVRLLVDRMEHAAHELEEAGGAAQHDDAHHALESLTNEVESLKEKVDEM